ncbi:hypothetical protein [Acetobacter sp.]|uniref:hypothetical protein n=1 Tax=Acetobacter sp. TaxID=440 RepID=UPI0039ED3585
MTNSANDVAAKEVTAIENKMISALTREQFEKIVSDEDAWVIVSHYVTCDFTPESGVTYCEMSIRNNRLGIFVSGIQFGSDEDGDVDDGFTSEHKFDDVKVFDDETNESIAFPVNFGHVSEDDDCDKGWFLDLIDDVVDDKISEVADEYSVSEQFGDDDFDVADMDTYGFGEPGRWSISSFGLERSDEDEDDESEEGSDTVTVTGEFFLSDFTNSNIDLDFKGCFDFSVTIKAEFNNGEVVRWSTEEVTCETDEDHRYGSIFDKLRSKFASWIGSSYELDDLCDYIVKNEMKLD